MDTPVTFQKYWMLAPGKPNFGDANQNIFDKAAQLSIQL